jgi:hypothetical protein
MVAQQKKQPVGALVVAGGQREEQDANAMMADREMGKAARAAAHEFHGLEPLLAPAFDDGRDVLGRQRVGLGQRPAGLFQFAQAPARHPRRPCPRIDMVQADVVAVSGLPRPRPASRRRRLSAAGNGDEQKALFVRAKMRSSCARSSSIGKDPPVVEEDEALARPSHSKTAMGSWKATKAAGLRPALPATSGSASATSKRSRTDPGGRGLLNGRVLVIWSKSGDSNGRSPCAPTTQDCRTKTDKESAP